VPSASKAFALPLIMPFLTERPRRLRRSERLRALVRETRLTADRLVYPLFVVPGRGVRREISSLPGCFHLSADEAAREAREVEQLGLAGVILFGLPESKDPIGSLGWADDGVVPQAVRAIRTGTAASSRARRSGTIPRSTCSRAWRSRTRARERTWWRRPT
jgi:porphobilinogen synthase